MDLPTDLVAIGTAPWDERPAELPLDVEEVRTALWMNRGNVSEAAKLLKVSSQRLRRFVDNNEYLKDQQNESREVLKDIAEENVYDALTDAADAGRRDSMSRFVLQTIGKDRGFGTGSSGINLKGPAKGRITITWDDGSEIVGEAKDITPAQAAE
jgi:hypothetical protein